MGAVNAFDWKAFTDEEHARRGDPFADIKRNAVISASVSEGIHKLREKNPGHGTVHGISAKRLNIKAPEMMGGARPNSGRRLPKIDERRAMSLLNQGLTKKLIAEKFGVPYKSMLTFFKKMGAQKSRGEYEWTGKYKKENSCTT
jgi:hypothetical protein